MSGNRIFISPSDQRRNLYAVGDTNEAEQCGRIGQKCKAALERCGFETMTVQYEPMSSKCAKSDAFGADLHLPIHTNAFDGKVAGTRMICYDLKGEGYRASKAIFDRLAPITPGTSENVSANPQLYEIRVPRAPTAYVEVDFHDNPQAARWIIDHPEEIGEALCHGVCDYFNVEYVAPGEEQEKEPEGEEEMRYQTIEDVPQWAREETQELIDSGALQGNEKGLDVTEDMLRTMIVSLRYVKSVE